MKKRILILGLMAVLATGMLFAGCKKKQTTSDVPVSIDVSELQSGEVEEGSEMILGGWEVNPNYTPVLSDEEIAIYDDGVTGLDGLSYDPVTVLATQVVSGTNYAFLVYGNETEQKAQGAQSSYAIAVVWQDTNGSSTLMNLTKINPADLHVKETGEDLVGSWTATDTGSVGMLPSEEAQTSFEDVTADLGKTFNPVILLGSQLVSGKNYAAISRGSDGQLYLSQWYRDLKGNAKMTVHGVLDWEYYNP